MTLTTSLTFVLVMMTATVSSFVVPVKVNTIQPCRSPVQARRSGINMSASRETIDPMVDPETSLDLGPSDRRTLLKATASSLALGLLTTGSTAFARTVSASAAAPGTKIVVLGGNGFVGSRVCEILVSAGAEVVSVSRSGGLPSKWAPGAPWTERVQWTRCDPLTGDLVDTFKGAAAVVSCVGVIGGKDSDMERGNGDVNAAAAFQARRASVPRFVYVSVSKVVPESFGGAVMKGYFAGKKKAEDSVLLAYPEGGTLIRPSFIYGGNSFELAPPRVPEGYGAAIDALLSSGPLRAIAGISPGLLKVALSPPVSRDNVALACVAGALGRATGIFDGADEINAAAGRA
ncbi:unnamed protein product [Discosporangium mesarthrocarpum]